MLSASTREKLLLTAVTVLLVGAAVAAFLLDDPMPALTGTYVLATIMLALIGYITAAAAHAQARYAQASAAQAELTRLDATAPW